MVLSGPVPSGSAQKRAREQREQRSTDEMVKKMVLLPYASILGAEATCCSNMLLSHVDVATSRPSRHATYELPGEELQGWLPLRLRQAAEASALLKVRRALHPPQFEHCQPASDSCE